jgi:GNAT superfamily N-acetyltransferase
MSDDYTLWVEDQPLVEDKRIVLDGLNAYNLEHAGPDGHREVNVFLRDGQGRVVGGALGSTYWGWLHVSILWVDQALRGQDYGTRLLYLAETEGILRGCRHAHLSTLDFQALPFYLKRGYTVYGQLEDLPPGHTRYFLKKDLPAGS